MIFVIKVFIFQDNFSINHTVITPNLFKNLELKPFYKTMSSNPVNLPKY